MGRGVVGVRQLIYEGMMEGGYPGAAEMGGYEVGAEEGNEENAAPVGEGREEGLVRGATKGANDARRGLEGQEAFMEGMRRKMVLI